MTIKNIEQRFSPTDQLVIKRFLAYVNDTAQTNGDFADASDIDALNQFGLTEPESDDDIRSNVKEWLRLKKVRLRGNFTNN
jgi:hypothetical protein